MDATLWTVVGGAAAVVTVLVTLMQLVMARRARALGTLGTQVEVFEDGSIARVTVVVVGEKVLYDLHAAKVTTTDPRSNQSGGIYTCWSLRHNDEPWVLRWDSADDGAAVEITWMESLASNSWRSAIRLQGQVVQEVYWRGRWYPSRPSSAQPVRQSLPPLPDYGRWFDGRRATLRWQEAKTWIVSAWQAL